MWWPGGYGIAQHNSAVLSVKVGQKPEWATGLFRTRQGPGSPGVMGMSGGIGSKGSEAGSVKLLLCNHRQVTDLHARMHASIRHSLNKRLQRTRLCCVLGILKQFFPKELQF